MTCENASYCIVLYSGANPAQSLGNGRLFRASDAWGDLMVKLFGHMPPGSTFLEEQLPGS